MSHKASHWLATIPADAINSGAFRVLFHLCDAHNSQRDPETACFPSQEKLRAATGLSNGGLNNALNALEAARLIRRRRTRNTDGTHGPTYYILGCDRDLTHEPSPQNGDGGGAENPLGAPVDKSVDKSRTVSSFGRSPSPVSGAHRLQWSGDDPIIEPVKEPFRARAADWGPVDNKTECPKYRAAVVEELARKYPGMIRPPRRVG